MPDTPLALEDDLDLQPWDSDLYGTPLAEADDVYKQSDSDFVMDPEVHDKYIGAKVILEEGINSGGNLVTVRQRATDK